MNFLLLLNLGNIVYLIPELILFQSVLESEFEFESIFCPSKPNYNLNWAFNPDYQVYFRLQWLVSRDKVTSLSYSSSLRLNVCVYSLQIQVQPALKRVNRRWKSKQNFGGLFYGIPIWLKIKRFLGWLPLVRWRDNWRGCLRPSKCWSGLNILFSSHQWTFSRPWTSL